MSDTNNNEAINQFNRENTPPKQTHPPRIKLALVAGKLSRWWPEVRWCSEAFEFDHVRGLGGEEIEYLSLAEHIAEVAATIRDGEQMMKEMAEQARLVAIEREKDRQAIEKTLALLDAFDYYPEGDDSLHLNTALGILRERLGEE